ncbi:hypothetical protein MRX96_015228 [Rhipicephalus microplus]
MDLRFPVAGASSPLGAPPTPAGLLRSLERRPGPSALHGGPLPGPAEPAAPDESEDRRSSPQIAASGFCFLAALCCSAGGFWASAAATRLLGVVFLVVGAASVLAAILFVPAGRDGKLPVHRRALPLLLALVLWAVAAWIIFLVAQSSVHGKGVLAAVAAFLLLFSLVLLRVVCRRCRHGRRPLKDAEDAVQLEDFHHVNTQSTPVVPTAPPETPPQASASFSTFVREPPSAPAEPPPYDGFPPDGSRCRTPPPPYSTLV